MPIFTVPTRPTAFQTLVMAAHEKLDQILAAERRDAPELFFGNPFQEEKHKLPRVGWNHLGGHFVATDFSPFPTVTPAPATPSLPAPVPAPQLGTRRAVVQCVIFHRTAEEAEHVLDRLWMSCRRGPADLQRFLWLEARYDFPTESQNPRHNQGDSIVVLQIPIDLPVLADYDGEFIWVEIVADKLRGGISDDVTDPLAPVDRAVEEFTLPTLP
jgi:hypothetical protein